MDKEKAKKTAKELRDLLQDVLAGVRDGLVDEEKAGQIKTAVREIMGSKKQPISTHHVTTLPPGAKKPDVAGPVTKRVVHDPAADGIDTWGQMPELTEEIPVTLPEEPEPPAPPPIRGRITVEVAGGKQVAISSPPPPVAPATGIIDDIPDPKRFPPRKK